MSLIATDSLITLPVHTLAEKDAIILKLTAQIQLLTSQNRLLTEKIAALERRLKLNSTTSNKPQSSDGLSKKPAPQSLREKSERSSGGQHGHKGHTLKQVTSPDKIVTHTVDNCKVCGCSLLNRPSDQIIKRQVFDIPPPIITITEHQAEKKTCKCGVVTTSNFPDTVTAPVQYGSSIQSIAVYLANQQLIPEKRLKMTLKDIFGICISSHTLTQFSNNFASNLTSYQSEVLSELKRSAVKHLDETGFRIGGKTQWLHVISNATATHYRISEKRSDNASLEGIQGIVVHDHWKPYFNLSGVTHALCNAHHLRELQALECIDDQEYWAPRMSKLLRYLSTKKQLSITKVSRLYDRIIEAGLWLHSRIPPLEGRKRRVGHNLLLRLKKYKDAVLRFFTNHLVPFTNNQAEQDIRMMKVKQKISNGFRTTKGAEDFACIRGFIDTKRKQNANIFQAIQMATIQQVLG